MNPYSFFYAAAVLTFVATWVALGSIWHLAFWHSWFIAASLTAFILCGFDKSAARHEALRVPERVLFIVALLGGSLGLLIGMNIFRHKTRKISFQIITVVILIAQLIALRYWSS